LQTYYVQVVLVVSRSALCIAIRLPRWWWWW